MVKQLLGIVLLLSVGYGLIEAWPLIVGPSFSISSPADNATIEGGIVTIEGISTHAAQLTLDGAPLLHDQNGRFSSILTFPRGGSILTFVATDRFGRTVATTRSIFVPF